MRVLSTYGSRGEAEPMVGLTVRMCAPPDFAELPRRAAELVAARFDTVAEGCDALVATGVMPAGVWR